MAFPEGLGKEEMEEKKVLSVYLPTAVLLACPSPECGWKHLAPHRQSPASSITGTHAAARQRCSGTTGHPPGSLVLPGSPAPGQSPSQQPPHAFPSRAQPLSWESSPLHRSVSVHASLSGELQHSLALSLSLLDQSLLRAGLKYPSARKS